LPDLRDKSTARREPHQSEHCSSCAPYNSRGPARCRWPISSSSSCPANDTAVKRRAHEGAQRPRRPSAFNGGLAGALSTAAWSRTNLRAFGSLAEDQRRALPNPLERPPGPSRLDGENLLQESQCQYQRLSRVHASDVCREAMCAQAAHRQRRPPGIASYRLRLSNRKANAHHDASRSPAWRGEGQDTSGDDPSHSLRCPQSHVASVRLTTCRSAANAKVALERITAADAASVARGVSASPTSKRSGVAVDCCNGWLDGARSEVLGGREQVR